MEVVPKFVIEGMTNDKISHDLCPQQRLGNARNNPVDNQLDPSPFTVVGVMIPTDRRSASISTRRAPPFAAHGTRRICQHDGR